MRAAVRPRRRRTGVRIVVGLLVVLGVLIAADRVSLVVAENAVARTVQQSQHLRNQPDVSIGGFPFLTQLVAGRFDEIRLSDHDVTVTDGTRVLRLSSVVVTLRQVSVARDFTSATASRTTATAAIGYGDLSAALGVRVGYAGDGKVRASATVTVAGVRVSGTVTARPKVDNGVLSFASPQVSVEGVGIPAGATAALAAVFGTPIPLSGLPYGLTVRGLAVRPDDITLSVAAHNLTFRR